MGRTWRLAFFASMLLFAAIRNASGQSDCFDLPVLVFSNLPAESSETASIQVMYQNSSERNCFTSSLYMTGPLATISKSKVESEELLLRFNSTTALLDLPPSTSFVLENLGNVDDSLIRESFSQQLFRKAGHFAPQNQHVLVFTSDGNDHPQYHGLFLISQGISFASENALNLDVLDNTCQDDELSGGWAWRFPSSPSDIGYSANVLQDKYEAMFGGKSRPIMLHPPPSMLTQTMRNYFVDARTGPLPQLYRFLYDNMTSPDDIDRHLDLLSFADFFLLSELANNPSSYQSGSYFYKNRGTPIQIGSHHHWGRFYPKQNVKDQSWQYQQSIFWKRLTCNYRFAAFVQQRWAELRQDKWSDQELSQDITRMTRVLRQGLNHTGIHSNDSNIEAEILLHRSNLDEGIDELLQAVASRVAWIDSHIAKLFRSLNSDTCGSAGALPRFNCAHKSDDDGCLYNPKAYALSVRPATLHTASFQSTCSSHAEKGALEAASIDSCWMPIADYLQNSALTPFCSGHGSCPPGPNAICVCSNKSSLADCSAVDSYDDANETHPTAEHESMQPVKEDMAPDWSFFLIIAGAFGVSVLISQQRRQRIEERNRVEMDRQNRRRDRRRARAAQYGTM